MIVDDYARGKGYDGFLKAGGNTLFARAIQSVADVWFTVLRIEGDPSQKAPSPTVVAWYLVDEMRYLLMEKDNLRQAIVTYGNFEKVNPGITDAYEKVGDLLYASGSDEAQGRAIREWERAYDSSGSDRRRIGKKLADHYVRVGEKYLEKASKPTATTDNELTSGLNAFNRALVECLHETRRR